MSQRASESSSALDLQPRWWLPIALILLLGVTVAALWPTVASLIAQWEDTDSLTYTHGYLIVLISAWLLWRAKPVSASVAIGSNPRLLPALAALSFLWLLAYRSGIEIGHQLLLPVLAFTAIYAAFGREVARRCAFALAYLYFAVPIWDMGNGLLQDITVGAVRIVLQISSVPAHVVGNYVHIPVGVFEIAGGCSGLHFFIVATAIAALYSELHHDTWRVRSMTIGLAVVLAVLTNWIRVASIIIAGYLTNMQHYLVSVSHYYYGWALFAVAMVAFFLIVRRLPSSPTELVHASLDDRAVVPGRVFAGIGATIIVLGLGPIWAMFAANASVPLVPARWPDTVGQFQSVPADRASAWQPVYEGADLQEQVHFRSNGLRLTAYRAAYVIQRQGKELISYGNSISGNLSPQVAASNRVESNGATVNELLLTSAKSRAIIYYYYRVGARSTPSEPAAQLLYGWQSVLSPPVAEVVAVYAECASDCESERSAALELLGALPATG